MDLNSNLNAHLVIQTNTAERLSDLHPSAVILSRVPVLRGLSLVWISMPHGDVTHTLRPAERI